MNQEDINQEEDINELLFDIFKEGMQNSRKGISVLNFNSISKEDIEKAFKNAYDAFNNSDFGENN